jgi:alcohol dehydrogenase (NADP+)
VPRKDIFIVTKLWNNYHHPEDVEKACDLSLKDLETDYLDLYLMHWPSAFARSDSLFPDNREGHIDYVDVSGSHFRLQRVTNFPQTWRAMEKLVEKGKCRAIGISNFSKAEIERLLSKSSTVPAAHQIENHPYLAQHSFDAFHKSKNIHITQYSPFGNQNEIYDSGKNIGKLIEDPVLVEIGKKYNKNGAQVALAWGIAKGHSVIPKSKTPSRIKANLEGDFKLDPEDVKRVDGMDKKMRFNDPSESFKYNFYTDLDGKA